MAKNEKKTLKPAKVGVKITRAVPVGAQLPCCDNSGAKVLNLFSVKRRPGVLNRLPSASIGDLLICSIRHGKPEMKKKIFPCLIVRQRKFWKRSDGTTVFCEDNGACPLTPKGSSKGTTIIGPITKESSLLWPNISTKASAVL